jgi:hypothetical protein
MKEDAEVSVRMVWYSALLFAIFVAIGFGVYALQPTWLGFERANVTNSHQYIEGKRTALLQLANEYEQNQTEIARFEAANNPKHKEVLQGMRNQQESLLARMKQDSSQIPEKEVPDAVKKLIWRAK